MKMIRKLTQLTGCSLVCLLLAATSAYAQCDRGCLIGHMDNYLEALAANDLSRIETTGDVVFVENNEFLVPGDGSWKTFTGQGLYRHYFVDPVTQQVAVISTMRENGRPVIYDLRLRLRDGKIAEIESVVIRDHLSPAQYENVLAMPPENFLRTVPEAQRVTRDELVAVADKYLAGMENNRANIGYPFFHEDCNRIEHGTRTTNNDPNFYGHSTDNVFVTLGCEEQFDTGFLGFVTRIRDRRYAVIDEEKQTVFGIVFLDQAGTVRDITMGDGSNFHVPPYFSSPRALLVGEAWHIRDHKLLDIEMTLTETPYGSRAKFDPDDGAWLRSPELNPANHAVPDDCGRQCLEVLAQEVATGFASSDIAHLPLSREVRYTENGQLLAVGDGLWSTATEIDVAQAILADPASGAAGLVAGITETDVQGLLSLRIKVADNRITEIEVMAMRHEYADPRGGTLTLMAPQLDGQYNPEQHAALPSAFASPTLTSVSQGAAALERFAPAARVNRLWVLDMEQGLALQQVISDEANAGAAEEAVSSGAYSVMTANLHKLDGGAITATRSVRRAVPYKMLSGWD